MLSFSVVHKITLIKVAYFIRTLDSKVIFWLAMLVLFIVGNKNYESRIIFYILIFIKSSIQVNEVRMLLVDDRRTYTLCHNKKLYSEPQ